MAVNNVLNFLFGANTLIGIGAVIFAIAYTYTSIRNGQNKSTQDSADNWKSLYESEKLKFIQLQKDFNDLRQEFGKLQGLFEAQEKKLGEYMTLFGPSGELQATLKKLDQAVVLAPTAMAFIENFPQMMKSLLKELHFDTKVK